MSSPENNKIEIVYDNETEKVLAITYTEEQNKYFLSNQEGHKVYTRDNSFYRPMTKQEYKETYLKILNSIPNDSTISDTILVELENLDFSTGHANSTFEIVKSYLEPHGIGALALNIGLNRYLYNQQKETIYHIDRSKLTVGRMLQSPEKDEIIKKLTTSKTMTKKLQHIINQ